jgi:hypothetical protein
LCNAPYYDIDATAPLKRQELYDGKKNLKSMKIYPFSMSSPDGPKSCVRRKCMLWHENGYQPGNWKENCVFGHLHNVTLFPPPI